MKRVLILMAAFAVAAMAADIAGTWKATAEGPNGTLERTFVFKVDGNKLTGETTSTMLGKSTIMDGKVDGDNLSFTITADLQGTELKLNYKGKVTGADLHLTSERAGDSGGQSIEWTGKKVQ
jgi:opacity protein-like surface antigen